MNDALPYSQKLDVAFAKYEQCGEWKAAADLVGIDRVKLKKNYAKNARGESFSTGGRSVRVTEPVLARMKSRAESRDMSAKSYRVDLIEFKADLGAEMRREIHENGPLLHAVAWLFQQRKI